MRFEGESFDSTHRKVLGWLGAIAKRLIKDRFREHAMRADRHDQFLADWSGRSGDAGESDEEDPAVVRLREALAVLSPTDADILRASLPWYDLTAHSFAVPRGEAARLASLFDLAPEAFRQRRLRAIRKLEKHLGQAVESTTDSGSTQ